MVLDVMCGSPDYYVYGPQLSKTNGTNHVDSHGTRCGLWLMWPVVDVIIIIMFLEPQLDENTIMMVTTLIPDVGCG